MIKWWGLNWLFSRDKVTRQDKLNWQNKVSFVLTWVLFTGLDGSFFIELINEFLVLTQDWHIWTEVEEWMCFQKRRLDSWLCRSSNFGWGIVQLLCFSLFISKSHIGNKYFNTSLQSSIIIISSTMADQDEVTVTRD